ncbi:hypothetical protein [Stenotrophomonas maltophilia]|uniref:hypothetical protein n=1 Tax=Stenotrophomonas maltophilia TaxID=40324 RepID=UPI00021E0B10|nr:hypothetical protein [Stenotrophomonas maltophilia]AEM51472.1 hypothetical protein BurJV3_2149 [Stenotrophomonas maltophilia JV3]
MINRQLAASAPSAWPYRLQLAQVSSYGACGAVVGILPLGDRFELAGKLYAGNERSHWREGGATPYWVKSARSTLGCNVSLKVCRRRLALASGLDASANVGWPGSSES